MPLSHSAIRIDRKFSYGFPINFRRCGLAILWVSVFLTGTAVLAADAGNLSDTRATYQRERAACANRLNEDRAACVREAGAAFDEARRGRLDDGQAQFEQNALIRCNALPLDDRGACQRRMRGEGVATGSVAEGGIYREFKEIVTPKVTAGGPIPATGN